MTRRTQPLWCPLTFQCSSASRKFLNQTPPEAGFCFLVFQCSSASRKFLNFTCLCLGCLAIFVSVLFSEPKIPQCVYSSTARITRAAVSVLFSEPKIPQFNIATGGSNIIDCFSALQRAENSSIQLQNPTSAKSVGFSALQRAENSSISNRARSRRPLHRFSALQRAENSSILVKNHDALSNAAVSVLFSEPKIPQSSANFSAFSALQRSFSALQRAENSSIVHSVCNHSRYSSVSVLFSEPKIPQ